MPAASKEIVFTLSPSIQISGRVQDATTGKMPAGLVEIERGTVDPQSGQVVRWSRDGQIFVHQGRIVGYLDASNPNAFRLRITAAGYEPFVSRTIQSAEGFVRLNAGLKKLATTQSSGLTGVVRSPDGKPLAGAEVVIASVDSRGGRRYGQRVSVAQGRVVNPEDYMIVTTASDGRFTLPPTDEPYIVLACTDTYYSRATKAEFEATHELKTQPWGRIEGQLLIGSKPGAGYEVSVHAAGTHSSGEPAINLSDNVHTDAEGRFAFRHIFAGNILLFYGFDKGGKQIWSRGNRIVTAESGRTTQVTLGGRGRPLIGRIAPPPDFGHALDFSEGITFGIESNKPWSYFPPEALKSDNVSQRMHQASRTPEQIAYEGQYVQIGLPVADDGSFRMEDVPAGTYRLNARVGRGVGSEPTAASGRHIANLEHFFTVPEMPGGRSNEPLDLGTIHLSLRPSKPLSDGDVAPSITATTLDGKPLKLADYRGKLVLLNFWAPWKDQSLFQIPYLKDVARTYEGKRFAIINLISDIDSSDARRLAAEVGLPGTLGFLGQWSTSPVIKDYGVEALPATFLIGPDGKILVSSGRNPTRLWMTQFKDEVARALKP